MTRFAQGISYVLTPLVLPTTVLVLALVNIGSQASDILAAGAIALAAFLLIPLADILWMIRRGKTTTPLDLGKPRGVDDVFVMFGGGVRNCLRRLRPGPSIGRR